MVGQTDGQTHEIATINIALYMLCMMTRNKNRELSRREMCPTEERSIARFLGALSSVGHAPVDPIHRAISKMRPAGRRRHGRPAVNSF